MRFLFDISSSNDFCFLDLPRTEEKTQVPRAALAAAKRPQEQRNEDRPFQYAAPMGTQDVLASTKRT